LLVEEQWSVDLVLLNLAGMAAELYLAKADALEQKQATVDDVIAWIALTRSIAARFPYGGPYADEMRRIADRIEHIQGWAAAHFKTPPRGRTEETESRFNCVLWGMDELRKAARLSPDDFWQKQIGRLFQSDEVGPNLEQDAIERRVARFRKNIQDGADVEVMREVLLDATVHGALLADGSIRPGLRTRKDKTPRRQSNIS
jgi:hypothetical protein